MMNYRVRYVAYSLIWVATIAAIAVLLSFHLHVPDVPRVGSPQNGPILFWQNGAIYIVNDNGTGLQKITPAAYADPKRQIAVSPGCFGQVQAGCYILVKHVLYDAFGNGLPLPINQYYQWINAPAVWAPDGKTLAYMVSRMDTGQRDILALNMNDLVVQKIASDVDDSVIPAWSSACTNLLSENCYFAYGIRTPAGETGNRVVVMSIDSTKTSTLKTVSGRGTDLRWSADDTLFYGGGELGWYNAFTNTPLLIPQSSTSVLEPSPNMIYVAYNTIPAPNQPPELWLSSVTDGLFEKQLYVFKNHLEGKQSAPQQILWSTDGKSFLAFDQGTLIHYNTDQHILATLYTTDLLDNFSGFAFSPEKDGVVLVEKSVARSIPTYRMFAVTNNGDVTVLLPRSVDPIVVLAWLPVDYGQYLLPAYRNDLL